MTDLELKNEIENGPLANIFLEFWNTGNDVAIAKIFNNPNLNGGYVEYRKLVSVLAKRNLLGIVLLASRFQKLPDGSTCSFDLYTLFATLDASIFGNISPPLQFEISLLAPALQALVTAKLITNDDKTTILAQEIQVSRATQLGWAVSIEDIAQARKAQ